MVCISQDVHLNFGKVANRLFCGQIFVTSWVVALDAGFTVYTLSTVLAIVFQNGHSKNPYCVGIEGILDAYRQIVHTLQFYGPTNFAPVISHVARFAEKQKEENKGYFVLLILTDGIISDMEETKEAIVKAASLPMSIIIIGVGPADFREMTVLDGDYRRIESRGRKAERDIVQFVPFRDYVSTSIQSGQTAVSKSGQLARAVLAEIPDQFLEYMDKMGVSPQSPQAEFTLPRQK
eukprot:m.143728 g.143728  ORF g.143728 m.143728 type:complete len:235 (+) comp38394_c1_seq58:1450-2154(+)